MHHIVVGEAVAIGFQEIATQSMNEMVNELKKWLGGNEFEKRAVVATLCEPKLLKDYSKIVIIFDILTTITLEFNEIIDKLSDAQKSLRKALGYGFSVAIVKFPNEGKKYF